MGLDEVSGSQTLGLNVFVTAPYCVSVKFSNVPVNSIIGKMKNEWWRQCQVCWYNN